MRKKERAEKKEKACVLFLKVLFYIFMASDLSPLENAMAVSPQCRLRTLHPCSTEAAWERPRSESVLRLKEEKENFSLSQTPTQMLTISIT